MPTRIQPWRPQSMPPSSRQRGVLAQPLSSRQGVRTKGRSPAAASSQAPLLEHFKLTLRSRSPSPHVAEQRPQGPTTQEGGAAGASGVGAATTSAPWSCPAAGVSADKGAAGGQATEKAVPKTANSPQSPAPLQRFAVNAKSPEVYPLATPWWSGCCPGAARSASAVSLSKSTAATSTSVGTTRKERQALLVSYCHWPRTFRTQTK
mmetsp:Transcript_9934/g.22311  ORF Transcript_9934/g.22311 Transcript_9934/m.22311 type:complete len:206 (-) Transcript_9934:891-1508(-)